MEKIVVCRLLFLQHPFRMPRRYSVGLSKAISAEEMSNTIAKSESENNFKKLAVMWLPFNAVAAGGGNDIVNAS
jgi:uncharacterized membrane protein